MSGIIEISASSPASYASIQDANLSVEDSTVRQALKFFCASITTQQKAPGSASFTKTASCRSGAVAKVFFTLIEASCAPNLVLPSRVFCRTVATVTDFGDSSDALRLS